MFRESHLFLDQAILPPSAELALPAPGWRFVCVLRGQGYLFAQPAVAPLNAGDAVVLSPEAEGLVRASRLGELVLCHFHLAPDLLSGLITLAERRSLDAVAAARPPPVLRFAADSPLARRFTGWCSTKGSHNDLASRCQMIDLAGAVFAQELSLRKPRAKRIASARDRFRQMIQQMTEAEFLSRRPEELASHCGCSLRHFSRLFRRHLGVSIRARQTQMRLLKARQLLADTREKVMSVASAAGYRHLGLFNAMFKKQFGMTPSEWRLQSQRHTEKPRSSHQALEPGPEA